MTRHLYALLLAAGLLAPAAASAQEVAGRVLLAIGAVTIERGAERIPARGGTEIRSGDTVQLGAQSNAQLLMTDESIVALRPDTTFRVKEYAYQGRAPERQSAFFELLKGGIRTVTGAIGRLHQANYGVATPTATIGIRGTHYTLVFCPERCGEPERVSVAAAPQVAQTDVVAQALPGGGSGELFGSVTDGRISVTNQNKQTAEFGADQYFRQVGGGLAERLLAPPPILRDRLAGRARAPQKKPAGGEGKPAAGGGEQQQQGGESANTVAQTGPGGGSGDTQIAAAVTQAAVPVVLNINAYQVTTAETTSGVSNIVNPTSGTGTVFFRLDGGVQIPAVYNENSTGVRNSFVTVDFITLGVNLGLGVARVTVGIRTDDATTNRVVVRPPVDIPITVSGGQITFSGSVLRSSFPEQQLAFRCENCGPNETVGFVDSVSISGVISGGTATVNFSGTVFDQPGNSGGTLNFTATLGERAPPNQSAAATVIPRFGGGANALVTSTFGLTLDGAGTPTQMSNGLLFAQPAGATTTVVGSDPAAGNLTWGFWSDTGVNVRDANFQQFVTGPSTVQVTMPWITGQYPNTLPITLGTATYSPIGFVVNGGGGVLNSGSLTADFVNRTMSVNLVASRTTGELNTFTMAGSSTFSPISAQFGAAFSSVTCSGPCTPGGTPGGSFGGFFSGPNAEGAGVAFTAGFGTAPGFGVSGVAAFKR